MVLTREIEKYCYLKWNIPQLQNMVLFTNILLLASDLFICYAEIKLIQNYVVYKFDNKIQCSWYIWCIIDQSAASTSSFLVTYATYILVIHQRVRAMELDIVVRSQRIHTWVTYISPCLHLNNTKLGEPCNLYPTLLLHIQHLALHINFKIFSILFDQSASSYPFSFCATLLYKPSSSAIHVSSI